MYKSIEVKSVPKMHFASLLCKGSQNLAPTFNKLIAISETNGWMKNKPTLGTIYYNSFKNTPANEVEMRACIQIKPDYYLTKPLELTSTKNGNYVVARFEINKNEFESAWVTTFNWMKQMSYKMNDLPPFELYYNNSEDHPEKKFVTDFFIPIKETS